MATTLPLPSNRSFGLTFTVVFALVGAWLAWKSNSWWMAFFGAAALFFVVSFAAPGILHPLNALWMRFGALLHHIVNPIVLGVIYFAVMTPTALVLRLRGRDALDRTFDANARSYWKQREPPGPDPEKSFPRQF